MQNQLYRCFYYHWYKNAVNWESLGQVYFTSYDDLKIVNNVIVIYIIADAP